VAAAAPAGLAHGCIKAAAARRVRFAEVAYLRAPRKGEPGAHEERSVVFLVDASAAAAPDAAAAAALAGARGAAAAEAAAKAALAAAEAEARAHGISHRRGEPQPVSQRGAGSALPHATRDPVRLRRRCALLRTPASAQVAAAEAAAAAAAAAAEAPDTTAAAAPAAGGAEDLAAEPGAMTVAALQEALAARGLDTKWTPLRGKKELVDRLQARLKLGLG